MFRFKVFKVFCLSTFCQWSFERLELIVRMCSDVFRMPQVSVLMSVYNGERHIAKSIDSVLSQTYEDFEFIVMNDGSTDNTQQIISSYDDSRIRVISQQGNIGLPPTLNRGLFIAKGEFIARIDADDICLSERLSEQVGFLNSNRDVAVVGCNAVVIGENGERIGKTRFPTEQNGLLRKMKKLISPFPHSSACFRRKVALDLNGYNIRFLRGQDFDLWLRMMQYFKIACIKEPLILLRKSPDSISCSGDASLSTRMGIIALIDYYRRNNNLEDFSTAPPEVWSKFRDDFDEWYSKRNYIKKGSAKISFKSCRMELKRKQVYKAFKRLLISVKLDPLFFAYRGLGVKFPKDIKLFIND